MSTAGIGVSAIASGQVLPSLIEGATFLGSIRRYYDFESRIIFTPPDDRH
jgi:hypothetical protein